MEVPDDQVLPFFREVGAASRDMALSIYETRRAKKVLSVAQHVAIRKMLPRYLMVKSNAGTVGDSIEGCRELSSAVNVFVGEHRWAELGPHGAVGACSSVIYWSPTVMLRAWLQLRAGDWQGLQAHCEQLDALFGSLDETFRDRGFTDTVYDRLGGLASGFLNTSLRNRAPYPGAEPHDIDSMRRLFERHYAEMLEAAGKITSATGAPARRNRSGSGQASVI
jgi:hypothetical protein